MSRSLMSRFFLIRAFVLLLSLMLLSTGFLFALFDELSCCKLGAGWGSRGESMLPFIGRPWRPKRARSHRNTVSSQRVKIVIIQAARA